MTVLLNNGIRFITGKYNQENKALIFYNLNVIFVIFSQICYIILLNWNGYNFYLEY